MEKVGEAGPTYTLSPREATGCPSVLNIWLTDSRRPMEMAAIENPLDTSQTGCYNPDRIVLSAARY